MLNFLRAADQDPAFAGELPRFVEEIQQIFAREEIGEAGAIDEDPVWWAGEILLIERVKALLLA